MAGFQQYWAIKYGHVIRIEKANNHAEAARLAFGTDYSYQYKSLGTRKTELRKMMTHYKRDIDNEQGWTKIQN